MATQTRPEPHAKNFGENIESDLALEFLRVVENAAIESARTMGQGDRPLSDQAATEAMRQTMDTVPMHGTIVIGEGERDDAPMLYIGEQVGGPYKDGRDVPMSTSPSIRSKAPTSAPPDRPEPSPSSPLPKRAACCMLPTATWKRLSSAPRAKTRWNSTLRWLSI